MRILIAGGRFEKRRRLAIWSFKVLFARGVLGPRTELVGIQGCASGWDTFGRQWFSSMGCRVEDSTLLDFPIRVADWERYGHGAGPVRNGQMLREGRPDLVVAGPGGTGTADMIEQSNEANVQVVSLVKEDWFMEGVRRYHALYGQ